MSKHRPPPVGNSLNGFKDLLKPALPREDFRVFVFGPYLPATETVDSPSDSTDHQDGLLSHAKYLRYATRKALEANGFPVDFGETHEVLKFWEDHFRSPDPATTEEHHARHLSGAVVIYPCSVGSFCEMGMFARERGIAEKMAAIVHSRFEQDTSFFRKGLLEVFQQEKGRLDFLDYSNHKACIEAALRFVEGEYNSAIRRVRTYKEINLRSKGTFLEKALGPSTH